MLQVGDKVEWIKTRKNMRDWFGTVLDVNGDMVQVEWVQSKTKILVQWNPVDSCKKVEDIPTPKRKSKKLLKLVPGDIPMYWRDEAKCKGMDVNLFCSYGTSRPTDTLRTQLEDICRECPVKVPCRIEALRTSSVGWWGGMDEPDRLKWGFKKLEEAGIC